MSRRSKEVLSSSLRHCSCIIVNLLEMSWILNHYLCAQPTLYTLNRYVSDKSLAFNPFFVAINVKFITWLCWKHNAFHLCAPLTCSFTKPFYDFAIVFCLRVGRFWGHHQLEITQVIVGRWMEYYMRLVQAFCTPTKLHTISRSKYRIIALNIIAVFNAMHFQGVRLFTVQWIHQLLQQCKAQPKSILQFMRCHRKLL